jgi:hypothetical protein
VEEAQLNGTVTTKEGAVQLVRQFLERT